MHYEDTDETTPGGPSEVRPFGPAPHGASWIRHAEEDDEPAFWLELAQERLLPVLTRCAA